jgi:hypothetical protein
MKSISTVRNYIEVLKVRETLLLGFLGMCLVIIAAGGKPDIGTLIFATLTVLVASGGANGLPTYSTVILTPACSAPKVAFFLPDASTLPKKAWCGYFSSLPPGW